MNLNLLILNIRYKMRYHLIWSLWYFLIYLFTMILTYYGLIATSLIGPEEGSFVYRLWGIAIFQFAISLKFREDFDFLLTLSNTRTAIFQSLTGVAILMSAFFSLIIVSERLVVDYLNSVFGYVNITDPLHFFSPYATSNGILQLLFFFGLCLALSAIGLMLGSLFYRYGRKFVLVFWLVFASIPVVFFPLLMLSLVQSNKIGVFAAGMRNTFRSFDLLACSGYMFVFFVIFSAIAFYNIRSLPQR
ncbi:MAG: hypothetical protein DWQ10_04065 [Calditrichaeota bacterium]|nr:MAG: hypothetical protein DWQ10_04065 [Calditrichota bacterium]